MENKLICTIITDADLATLRRFYVDALGWEVTMELDRYLQVRHGSAGADPELAFSSPEGAAPLGVPPRVFGGEGLVLSFPVPDVDAHHAAVQRAGVTPDTEPADMPWGWRSHVVTDPIGIALDFCQQVAQPATT